MNKVKYINVVNEQDEIVKHLPIGVDAVNVDLEDGQNAEDVFVDLQDKINKKPYYFDNVEKMKSANLKEGDCCITLGYYETNDGGGATYLIRKKIRNDIDDAGSIHIINNDLVAELIIENGEVIVSQFGAKGDAKQDDTNFIQNAINFVNKKNCQTKILLLDKIYLISNLIIYRQTRIKGVGIENTQLLLKDGSSGDGIALNVNNWHYCLLEDFTISCKSPNNTIENAIHIKVTNPQKDSYSTIKNLRIHYIPNGNGLNNEAGGREIRVDNLIIRECGGHGLIAGSSDSLYYNISSNFNKKTGIWNRGSNNRFVNCKCYCNGVAFENEQREYICGFLSTGGISTFTACDSQENYGDGFVVAQHGNTFINCKADANGQASITFDESNNPINPTDDQLTYSGFFVSTFYTKAGIKNCNLIISADDFRRSTGRQLQKYGIDMEQLTFSNVIITSRNQVQDIYYGTGYAINTSGKANNYVVLNGNYLGSLITDSILIENMLDILDGSNNYQLHCKNSRLQLDYKQSGIYKNSPLSIRGGENDGYIETDANYNLKFKAKGLGFFNASGYAQQAAPASASNLDTCITAVNSLITKLKNYGLLS